MQPTSHIFFPIQIKEAFIGFRQVTFNQSIHTSKPYFQFRLTTHNSKPFSWYYTASQSENEHILCNSIISEISSFDHTLFSDDQFPRC